MASVFSIVFFDLMLFLANMDVSLVESVRLGDFVLLVAFLLAHLLGVYHFLSRR